jgi:iron only hydrogenase large subunit-like protein
VRLHDPAVLKATVIDGLNKAGMKQLVQYGKIRSGEMPVTAVPADTPNLIEVMACQGGCIAGPSVITNPKVAAMQLAKYVEAGAADLAPTST